MTRRRVSVLAVLLGALLLGACASPGTTLTPVNGVGDFTQEGADWLLHVPTGIAKLRLVLPPQGRVRLRLYYAPGRPFERLEGVQVVDNATGSSFGEGHPAVSHDGRQRVSVTSGAEPLDLMLQLVDYYR
ncbi:MAG TPA: hypothetical protein VIX81_03825 [Gammaproteobacteria bacterium]